MTNVTNLSTSRPVPLSWVESLFARMEGMYGSKFLDMWRGADIAVVKALWSEEMGKLSAEELKRGYSALMSRDWPPSLPEYVKMCRPGIDPLVAYYEAVQGCQERARCEVGTWSHPAIFWAAATMTHDLLNQTYSQVKPRWERAFSEQMERGEWAEIPKPMIALPAPGKAELSKNEAAKMLSQIGASGILKRSENDTGWYKKILARIKSGDKTVTLIQRTFAMEAAEAHGYRE